MESTINIVMCIFSECVTVCEQSIHGKNCNCNSSLLSVVIMHPHTRGQDSSENMLKLDRAPGTCNTEVLPTVILQTARLQMDTVYS